MDWIYLSPHLDDIALSCGGLVWEQTNSGDHVEIWSICAGDPPEGPLSQFAESLHQRWKTGRNSTEQRRKEDIKSCACLKAIPRHFHIPDCIYRRSSQDGHPLYASEEAIFGPMDPSELGLVEKFCSMVDPLLPKAAILVSPLAVGGHIDHQFVRAAAEKLEKPLWYYPDYPYVDRPGIEIGEFPPANYQQSVYQVSDQGMHTWFESVAAIQSQISTFWQSSQAMRASLQEYYSKQGGIALWKPASPKMSSI